MNSNKKTVALFVATLVTGLYAGTGFFVLMGGNPAIEQMSSATFAEYWHYTDLYMAARMKFFGPILLVSVLLALLLHIRERRTRRFWFLLFAFAAVVADIIIVFTGNHPLNQLIQSWDLQNLPDNVQQVKFSVVDTFRLRSVFMIAIFVFVLGALFSKSGYNLKRYPGTI